MADITTDIIRPGEFKTATWVGSSRDDVRQFPAAAQDSLGYQLYLVQVGRMPTDWKSMHAIGSGVCEIRSHAAGEHRLIYVVRFEEAVYVLHAFEKRSRKTPRHDIEVAKRRLAQVVERRRPRAGR